MRVAMFFDTKWRRGKRPNRLASFFTAARQLVSEVESYFSSDEDGNLDRLELLEGRLEQACETLHDGLFSGYSKHVSDIYVSDICNRCSLPSIFWSGNSIS